MKILITGKPGSGKTTLLKKIYERIKNKTEVRGFFTGEIREGRKRVGFYIENVEGKRDIFAHIEFESTYKVGRYGVDVKKLEDIGVPEIEKAIRDKALLLIDEIGKMELFSESFKNSVKKAFDSHINIIATIAISPHPFIKELKKRNDVKIFGINEEKREYLLKKILKICEEELKE